MCFNMLCPGGEIGKHSGLRSRKLRVRVSPRAPIWSRSINGDAVDCKSAVLDMPGSIPGYSTKLSREGSGHQRGLISLCHPWFKSKSRNQIRTLAQLVERLPYTQNVGGSNPSRPTIIIQQHWLYVQALD